jgi:hypothetical protein
MATRKQFDAARAAYLKASEKEKVYRREVLLARYGRHDPPRDWLSSAERNKIAQFRTMQDRAFDRLMTIIDAVSVRNWHTTVPQHWIAEYLTWEDAITTGPLAHRPPPAYGCTERDVTAFVREVKAA